jgi:hypothetical protein
MNVNDLSRANGELYINFLWSFTSVTLCYFLVLRPFHQFGWKGQL